MFQLNVRAVRLMALAGAVLIAVVMFWRAAPYSHDSIEPGPELPPASVMAPAAGSAAVVLSPNIASFAAAGPDLSVISANTLAAGDTVSIWGSVTPSYNGEFVVISATPAAFTVGVPFVASDTSSNWSKVGGAVAGCSGRTTGTAGAITLPAISAMPSRVAGVAPLAVFFDASGTTATSTQRPFHELEYRWDFGDPAGSPISGAAWGQGNRPGDSSRNSASGAVAAHVFERPGTFKVTLTATDGKNTVSSACIEIAVQDPEVVFAQANTICFSASGNFAGAPAGACTTPGTTAITTADFAAALATHAAPGKRLLFRRGETFVVGGGAGAAEPVRPANKPAVVAIPPEIFPPGPGAPSRPLTPVKPPAAAPAPAVNTVKFAAANLSANGPGIIGAFGDGSAPVIRSTVTTPYASMLTLSTGATPGLGDWRIMDLEFDGQSKGNLTAISGVGGFDQLTLLRLNIHDVGSGISFAPDHLDSANQKNSSRRHHIWDQLTLADSIIKKAMGGNGNVGLYIGATRLAVLGNLGDDSTQAEHVMRFPYIGKGVVSHNTMGRAASAKHVLTIRANCTNQACKGNQFSTLLPADSFTEKIVVSGNKFVGLDNPVTVQFAPSSVGQYERLRDVIAERNLYLSGRGTQFALSILATDVTVRNELCNMTGAAFHTCISVGGSGAAAPPSSAIHIYHNTFFSHSAGDFIGVTLGAGATGIKLHNNLGFAPNATDTMKMVIDRTGNGLVQSHNSTDAQMKSAPAGFKVMPPAQVSDWKLACKNTYPCAQGAAVPVWSDFFGAAQPDARDLGAVTH